MPAAVPARRRLFRATSLPVASVPGRAMSYSAADLEAACAVILAALEEGEDLAPFLQQFPPGARRSLVLMLQATLPATRAASTTPAPAPAPPVVPKAAGASACAGSSGSNEGGASSSAGPAVPEPSPEPPAAAASSQAQTQAQPAPWPLPPQRKQPPTVPADITGGQQPAQPAEIPAKAKPKGPPVALWESSGYMTEADARRAEELNFLTAEAFYHAMAAARAQKAAPPKKASFPPARPAPVAKTPAPDSPEMEALQLRIAGEIAAGASASSAAPAPVPEGFVRMEIRGETFTVNRSTGEGFPELPRRPARTASDAERRRNDDDFRRLVDLRVRLCSVEWQAHIREINQPGATSSVPVPAAMQPSVVASVEALEEIEDAMRLAGGAPTAVVPTAPGAADYIVRSLAPNFLGGRIPERLAGEVWCVGWCGRPCPGFEGSCYGGGGRCLRPVLIRRGGTVALEAHSNHLCDRCRRFRNTRDNRF